MSIAIHFASTVVIASLAAAPAFSGDSRSAEQGARATLVSYSPVDIVDTAVSAGTFNTLAAALKAAGLVDALKGKGPFTVFAPTDEAFAKLPPGTVENLLKPENKQALIDILTYHVVPGAVMAADVVKVKNAATLNGQRVDVTVNGSVVKIDNARVIKTDIAASNGVIHVIDAVILPQTNDVVQTAKSAGMFKTLLAAIDAAGLESTLQSAGPFTVFAPTDEAFAKLPPGTVENLLKPENREMLINILTSHVVAGRVYSEQVAGMTAASTLSGAALPVKVGNIGVTIGGAKVVKADVDAANGVVHVIDTVIIPATR